MKKSFGRCLETRLLDRLYKGVCVCVERWVCGRSGIQREGEVWRGVLGRECVEQVCGVGAPMSE